MVLLIQASLFQVPLISQHYTGQMHLIFSVLTCLLENQHKHQEFNQYFNNIMKKFFVFVVISDELQWTENPHLKKYRNTVEIFMCSWVSLGRIGFVSLCFEKWHVWNWLSLLLQHGLLDHTGNQECGDLLPPEVTNDKTTRPFWRWLLLLQRA